MASLSSSRAGSSDNVAGPFWRDQESRDKELNGKEWERDRDRSSHNDSDRRKASDRNGPKDKSRKSMASRSDGANQRRKCGGPFLLVVGAFVVIMMTQAPQLLGRDYGKLDIRPINGFKPVVEAKVVEEGDAEALNRRLMAQSSVLEQKGKENFLEAIQEAKKVKMEEKQGHEEAGEGGEASEVKVEVKLQGIKVPEMKIQESPQVKEEAGNHKEGRKSKFRRSGVRKFTASSTPPVHIKLLETSLDAGLTPLEIAAGQAWAAGLLAWGEADAELAKQKKEKEMAGHNDAVARKQKPEACLQSLMHSGEELAATSNMMELPCGMTVGSAITIVGTAVTPDSRKLSGFHVELQGLRVVDGEDPPRIYHLNPRLNGDWSGRPVIEQNTCYRSQWGIAQRCEGWPSKDEEERVDGERRCEKWSRLDHTMKDSEKNSGWLQRLIHRTNKELLEWPYPLSKDKLFVLTIRAGWEGFHVGIDGNHVTSFPYRTGYIVEEATGLHLGGDLQVEAIFATSLPMLPPARHAVLELSDKLKAPEMKEGTPVVLFIGILSASNHFEERLAVRKTWLQHPMVRSGEVVVRFFVAMHPSKLVNVEVRKEAKMYGDMVIIPFIDRYDLVVLKTIAILEYGVNNVTTTHIMKADDDNFVRISSVLHEIRATKHAQGLYMGNINEFHKPLREGKWAVTEEEWPETAYPPYANGPGYVVSTDVARYIVDMKSRDQLRIFKMEDVSMGMWVVQYSVNHTLHYVHNWKFVQFGCLEDYISAHYQSPRQMVCMWGKLSHGEAKCCNQ